MEPQSIFVILVTRSSNNNGNAHLLSSFGHEVN